MNQTFDSFDEAGMIVNVFGRTEDGSYSHYEFNSYGKKIAQIVIELEEEVEDKIDTIIEA